jgi:predicted ribosome quality control (RQC) complex YloA/Tae2 family protein
MKFEMKTVPIYVDENDKTYDLLIGQTQRENDQILRECDQDDTWFHLENVSGPHFILRNSGDSIPKRYLNQIAGLFIDFKKTLPNRYSVIYTELKNVKLTKTPGQVLTSKTKVIKI